MVQVLLIECGSEGRTFLSFRWFRFQGLVLEEFTIPYGTHFDGRGFRRISTSPISAFTGLLFFGSDWVNRFNCHVKR